MALSPGTRLGVYEVIASIGVGGMGEVYRATDTTLGRQVAIKILPDAFASDPERLARFEREAKTLASLNHPHIAAIYGFEQSGGTHALVMELVEGEDLSQRISRGAMPLDEALPIAKQIAEALEAAHEQGIIHRDLKPANIKVRADGTVKVLDFGLAKAIDPPAGLSATAMNSPTLSMHATQAGIILGTAAYMSPEQAAGKPVDKRSDLWSFGVVVLEMLTGQPVFTGETVPHVLASVLKSDPDWTTLPVTTPSAVRRLLRRCLEKDRKRRLSDAADARLEIEEALTAPADGAANLVNFASPTPTPVASWRQTLSWAVAAAALGAAAVLTLWAPWRSTTVPAPRKLLAGIGADASLVTDRGASAILSPDGTMLAFVALQAGQTRLFIRKLDQLQASALTGTEGAASPFFSPDGQWIAFFGGDKLKKVSVAGGAVIALCDAPRGRGGTWADDDAIIFTPQGGVGANSLLMRISAAGGKPAPFGTPLEDGKTQRWPQTISGGNAILYTEHSAGEGFDGANIVVAPLAGGTPKIVVRGGYFGRYVASGHLIYMEQGRLMATGFDSKRLETIGRAVPVLEGLSGNLGSMGSAQLSVSLEGTLVYVPGRVGGQAEPIEWTTRDGKTSMLRATPANWTYPRFSPDGQKLAIVISDSRQDDIWVYDWARDTLAQLTFDQANDSMPVWTPDGRRIVFASDRAKAGISNLYWMNADGTGEVTRLTDSPNPQTPDSWHPSGRFLAFHELRPALSQDLMLLSIEGDAARGWTPGKSSVFLSTAATESNPMFSPDGRWIAYGSNEAGNDVYVRPFPGPGGKWRVSTEGASLPRWSAAAYELLFVSQGRVMATSYSVVGDAFRADKPQVWSPTRIVPRGNSSMYDIHPDGTRLALSRSTAQNVVEDKVVFVFNFADYLRSIAPVTK